LRLAVHLALLLRVLVLLLLLILLILILLVLILLVLLVLVLLILLILILLVLVLLILLLVLVLLVLVLLLLVLLILLLLVLLVLLLFLLLFLLLLLLLLLLQLSQGQFQVLLGLYVVRIQAQSLLVGLDGGFVLLALEKDIAQVVVAVLIQVLLALLADQGLLDLELGLLIVLQAVVGVGRIIVRLGHLGRVLLGLEIGGQRALVILFDKGFVALIVQALGRRSTAGERHNCQYKNRYEVKQLLHLTLLVSDSSNRGLL